MDVKTIIYYRKGF